LSPRPDVPQGIQPVLKDAFMMLLSQLHGAPGGMTPFRDSSREVSQQSAFAPLSKPIIVKQLKLQKTY
jgi:hypothetical protein